MLTLSSLKVLAVVCLATVPLATASPLDHIISGRQVDQTHLPICAGQHYDPTQYTCYGNEHGDSENAVLCPFQNGFPQDRCGDTKKCYLPFRYGCDNGELVELPEIQSPFELVAVNLVKVAYVRIKACSNAFWIKDGETCSYCPDKPRELGACPPGNDTVFYPGGGMATVVPGGQRYWVNPDTGVLEFSVPHSAAQPRGALTNFVALQNGTFAVYPGARGWSACPTKLEGDPSDDSNVQQPDYKIIAQLPGLALEEDCVPVNLITAPWKVKDGSNSTAAAWEYV